MIKKTASKVMLAIMFLFILFHVVTPVTANGTDSNYYTTVFTNYINNEFDLFDEAVTKLPEYQILDPDSLPEEYKKAYWDYLSAKWTQTTYYSFVDMTGDGIPELMLHSKSGNYASFLAYDETENTVKEIGFRNNGVGDKMSCHFIYGANPDGPGIFRFEQLEYSGNKYETVEFIDSENCGSLRGDSSRFFTRSRQFSSFIPYKLIVYTLDENLSDCPFRFEDNNQPDPDPSKPTVDTNPTNTTPPATVIKPTTTTQPATNPSDSIESNRNTTNTKVTPISKTIKTTAKYKIVRIDRSIRTSDGRVAGKLFYDKVVLKGNTKGIKKINKAIEANCRKFFAKYEKNFTTYTNEMISQHGINSVVTGGLECSNKSTVTCCNTKMLSFYMKFYWFAGGTSQHTKEGRTYSLKKGTLLKYCDVMNGKKENIKKITKYLLRKKAATIADDYSINNTKHFYVKNNKMYICYSSYKHGGYDTYCGSIGKLNITKNKKLIKKAKQPWTYGLKKNTFYSINGCYGTLKGNTFSFSSSLWLKKANQTISYKSYKLKLSPKAKFYATDGTFTDRFTKNEFAKQFINNQYAVGINFKLNSSGQIIDMHYSP